MRRYLLAGLCLTEMAIAASSSKNAEAFEATKQYTQELTGEKERLSGRVVETLDVANYTYVQFKQGAKSSWMATNKIDVKKGDVVSFEGGQVMHNFHSKTLNRTFEAIYFVNDVTVKR